MQVKLLYVGAFKNFANFAQEFFFGGGGWEGGGLFVLILLAVPLYEKQLTHANNCTVTLYLLITYQYKWESLCYRG